MGNWKFITNPADPALRGNPMWAGVQDMLGYGPKTQDTATTLPKLPPRLPDLGDANIRAAAYSERQRQMGQGRRSTFLTKHANPNDTINHGPQQPITVLGG